MAAQVGQTAQRTLTLTAEHVETFAKLTGDYNPLHFDAEFAKGTRFGALVVQGGLTTGLLHALVAMDLPGPLHRRHDHRAGRSRERPRVQARDATQGGDHAANG